MRIVERKGSTGRTSMVGWLLWERKSLGNEQLFWPVIGNLSRDIGFLLHWALL